MRAVALLVVAVSSVAVSSAQVSDIIHVDVRVVSVTASVSDRSGAPLTHLKRDDFTILDQGKPREIQSFWQESDVPLTIGLIADVSGSQAGLIRRHRETISRFLSQVISPQDRAFIVTVGGDVRLLTDLTHSIDELRAGIDGIDLRQTSGTQLGEPCSSRRARPISIPVRGCGGTALWNGVYAAARIKMKPLTGRKALLVLSDGLDTGSTHSLTEAIEAAQSADTLVYTLRAIGPTVRYSIGGAIRTAFNKGLQRLSEETGGRASNLPSDPTGVFAQIEAELRNLYVLGFAVPPEERDGKFHPIEVKTNIPRAVVRARKGYVPEPGF